MGVVVLLVPFMAGCGDDEVACEEDIRAQVLEQTLRVAIGDLEFEAELAETEIQRARGWRHRRCDREAIVLVADGNPLPVWMCEVPDPLDLVFVHDGQVVALVEAAPPCAPPCDRCPRYGESVPVDAVIEWPAGRYAVRVGDGFSGLP